MGACRLFRHFLETKVDVGNHPDLQLKMESFKKACSVVDLIVDAKMNRVASREAGIRLRGTLKEFIATHLIARGGPHLLKPKHHWMWDVADQLMECPIVVDCFIMERYHLGVKEVADNIDNTRSFEASVQSAFLISRGSHSSWSFGLHGPSTLVGLWGGFHVADIMNCFGAIHKVGDIVMRNGVACELKPCLCQHA